MAVWLLQGGTAVFGMLVQHMPNLTCMLAAGTCFFIYRYDDSIFFWDTETGCSTGKLPLSDCPIVGALAFSLDGKRLAASLHDSVVIIDLPSKEFVCTFEQPGSAEFAMFSPDGMVLLSSSDDGVRGQQVRTLRDVSGAEACAVISYFEALPESIAAAAWAPNGRYHFRTISVLLQYYYNTVTITGSSPAQRTLPTTAACSDSCAFMSTTARPRHAGRLHHYQGIPQ